MEIVKNKILLCANNLSLRCVVLFLFFLALSTDLSAQACNTPWNSSTVYASPTSVSHNGRNYTSKWWTQNNTPGSDPSGVWTDNGPCSNCTLTAGSIGSPQAVPSNSMASPLTNISSANASNGSTLNYQWQKSTNNSTWTDIAGANSSTYSPGIVTSKAYYRRKVSAASCGDAFTSSVVITIAVNTNIDSDGDGVLDATDLDDDNDGILDCSENGFDQVSLSNIFNVKGSANFPNNNEIQLTPDLNSQAGSAMSLGKLDFNKDFNFNVEVYLGANDGGADGMTVVFHNDPDGINTVGGFGGGLGAQGIQNGISIEFDTWDNGEVAEDHTQIKRTDNWSDLTSIAKLPNIEDSQWHLVNFQWNASTQTLSYSFDGNLITNFTNDLVANVFNNESDIYFGFTAGTGGAKNEQKIRFPDSFCTYPIYKDSDNDGIVNSLDADSDGDGCSDALEGGAAFTSANVASNKLTGGVDAKGVPLLATASGQAIGNSQDANAKDPSCPLCSDNDNDAICDNVDLDDDNDGILDKIECGTSNFQWSSAPTLGINQATGTINGVNYTYTSTTSVQTTSNIYNHGIFPATYGIPNTTSIQNISANSNTLTFGSPVANPVLIFSSIGNGGTPVGIQFNNNIEVLWSSSVVKNSDTKITGTEGYAIIRINGLYSSISFDYLASESYCNFMFGADFITQTTCDTDNDGIPDYFDLDSDNDGCSDAVEGGASFTKSNLASNMLSGAVDANGIPVIATSTGQAIGSSKLSSVRDSDCGCVNDNDNDNVCDEIDLDDDNDGILDTEECKDNSASWDFETPVVGAGNNNQGTAFQGWTCTGGGWINLIHPPYGGSVPQTAASGAQYVEVGGTGIFERSYTVSAAGVVTVEIDFACWGGQTEQTQLNIYAADGVTLVAQSPVITTPTPSSWNDAWKHKAVVSANLSPGNYLIRFALGNFQAFDNVKISSASLSTCDTDGDGIINSFDTDSDGDGCVDALEGGAAFKGTDLNGQVLAGSVDAKGVPVVATASGQSIGTSQDKNAQDVQCCTKPTATTSATKVCAGDTISASASTTGTWSSSNTGVATISSAGVIKGLSSGTTTFIFIGTSGCSDTTDAVTVNAKPLVNLVDASICAGDAAHTFDAGAGFTSYAWSDNGTGTAQTTAASTAGTYTVRVADANGCKDTASALLAINVKPSISVANATICEGDPAHIFDAGAGYSSYTWSANGTGAAQTTSGTSAGTYTVSVTDAKGCKDTTTAVLTVNTKPNITLANASICVGDPAHIFDAGAGYSSYTWSANGTGTAQTTSASTIGTYTVAVSDANGCKDTASASLTLKADCPCVNDNDIDGVCDDVDLDDDNDGILDAVECPVGNFQWSTPPQIVSTNTATGTIHGFVNYTYTSDQPIQTENVFQGIGSFPAQYNLVEQKNIMNTNVSSNTIVFDQPVTDPILAFGSIGAGGFPVGVVFSDPVQILWSQNVVQNSPNQITGSEGHTIVKLSGVFTQFSFNYLVSEFRVNFAFGADFTNNCDIDNDGITNSLDFDSDGDGCADAVEGAASFKKSDLNNEMLAGGVDANGVPLVAGASGQAAGTSANALIVDVDCNCSKPLPPVVDGSSSAAFYSFDFSATQELNEVTPVFANGKKYQFKVTGTWSVWSNDPSKNALDAAFRYADNSTGAPLGSPFANGYVKLDGNTFPRPDTNVYKANHEYWYSFTGQGQALNFTFTDSPYSDNHGGLNFTFFAPADTIKVCASNSTSSLDTYVTGANLLWYTTETGGVGTAVSPNVNNSAAAVHTYWVSQTVNDCESDRSLLIYKVESIPNLIIVGDTAICEGDPAVLFDAGVGFASYAWSGAKTASSQSISANVAGMYQVVVASSSGTCKDTASVKLSVHAKPQVLLANATICSGDAAITFDAGAGYASYEWSENGTGISQSASGKNAGSYTVKVSDANGCKDTATAVLTVNTKPNISLADTTLCSGDVLGVFNAGAGFTSYAWSGKGIGNTQSSARTSAGVYTVSVVDANGCKDTASATLSINTKPNITLSDTTICAGDKAGVFKVAAQFASYTWSGNGTGNSSSTARANAGVYTVSVIDAKGCKDTASAILTINSKPNVVLTNDTICEGDAAITFDAGAGYSSYLWSGGGSGNAQTISTALAGTYTVKVVDANGCKDTASAVLKVNQKPNVQMASIAPVCIDLPLLTLQGGTPLGGIYEIQHGANWQQDSVVQIPKKSAGSYAIRYTYSDANSCVNTASATLVINNLPTLNIADQEICEGESATFNAGTTFKKYLWSNGSNLSSISTTKAGTYGVLVTDANGCITGDTMNLAVNALPMVDLGDDQKVCDGEVVVLSSVSPAASYLWSDGSSNAQLTVNKSGKYSLTVTDSKGCKSSDQAEVNVVPLPKVDLGDDQEICEGDSAILTISDKKASYVWSTNDKSATVSVGSSQTLFLTQYYDTQCMVSDTASVVVVSYPVSTLGNDTTVCFGETLGGALTLEASNFADNFLWSDGSTNSSIAVSAKGTYSVTMTNGKNCTTNDEIKVNEFCKTSIFMPNAFTPNNDGTNDVFYVAGMYVEDFHLLIFNRWGEIVFESYDINKGWDGTVLGDKAQIDVYVVKLFYKENTEWGSTSKNEMISSLTLIR